MIYKTGYLFESIASRNKYIHVQKGMSAFPLLLSSDYDRSIRDTGYHWDYQAYKLVVFYIRQTMGRALEIESRPRT